MYDDRSITEPSSTLVRPGGWPYGATIILFALVMLGWLIGRPGSPTVFTAGANILQFSGPLLALVFFGHAVVRRRVRGMTPWLLASGVLCYAVGQLLWTYFEVVLGRLVPMPGPSDLFFLAAYPFFLAGILRLPRQAISRAARTRVTLDGLIIMVATATFSWYFILGPTYLAGAGTALEKVVELAYPLWDLVLIGCLLLLLSRSGDPERARTATILIAAVAVIVAADSNLLLQNLAGSYATGSLLDIGWPVGYMLVMFGALTEPAVAPANGEQLADSQPLGPLGADAPRVWLALLPYAVLPLIAVLLVYALGTAGAAELKLGVYAGCALLLALVLLRQVLAMTEHIALNRALRASYTTLAIQNQALGEANLRLESLSTIDPLTDLPNHRAMVLAIDAELERGQRWSQPFAALFLDLDHFKSLNDGYGHLVGDAALREFGAVVRDHLRAVDTFGRWGGEEFIAVLPQTDRESALAIAERVRAAVAVQPFTDARIHLTCSIGVAIYPAGGAERNELIASADYAMYAAKHLGRNQVRAMDDPLLQVLKADASGSRSATALACTVDALAELVEMRDRYTGRQTEAVAELALRVAVTLGCDEAETQLIGMAGRLHDIGKVALPDAVLQKPGRLTDDEWLLVRTHPVVGADVVGRVPSLRALVPLIRHHHEHWNGAGYPDGLAGEVIPLGARIVGAADAFMAMTSDRPYRQARTVEAALAELRRCAATQFDPAVVAALSDVVGRHTLAPAATQVVVV